MAILRNRYHERAWFLGRHSADPDETIEVPDGWVEERDPNGNLTGGLAEDDPFWERLDRPAITRAELDAQEQSAAPPVDVVEDVPAAAVERILPPE